MDAKQLSARPKVEEYREQAKDLLKGCVSTNKEKPRWSDLARYVGQREWEAIARIKRSHPRLGKLSKEEIRKTTVTLADAQWLIARQHGFASWRRFSKFIEEITQKDSFICKFETAADAIVEEDVRRLKKLLAENPELVRARSSRAHGAPLIHYVAANGVEDFRQKTPPNIVAVTKLLLSAGAEVDAISEEYGSASTALGLAATSYHPAKAGVQMELLETLLRNGACIDGAPGGWNPLVAALHNGRGDAAAFLAERGARLDLEAAAGVGRIDLVKTYFNEKGGLRNGATKSQLDYGFTWACEYGRTEVVDFLLRQVPDLSRRKITGQTGLHWAAYGGHVESVKVLLKRGASVDVVDEHHGATPLGWALYAWSEPPPEFAAGRYHEVAEVLVNAGASVDRKWIEDPNGSHPIPTKIKKDTRMARVLKKALKPAAGPKNQTNG